MGSVGVTMSKEKKKYIKPEMKTEKIGDASAAQPPMGPGPVCDGGTVSPKKTGAMGDGCKVKLT